MLSISILMRPLSYEAHSISHFSYDAPITSMDRSALTPLQAQRDAEIRIPINFVTSPGVSVSAACFANNRYEDYATVTCISNLLTAGFRRLHIDLYWDAGRRRWSFCPVSLPTPEEATSGHTIAANAISARHASPTIQAATPSNVAVSEVTQFNPPPNHKQITARQLEDSVIASVLADTSESTETTVQKATAVVSLETSGTRPIAILPTSVPPGTGEILFSIGPYVCSGTGATDILNELLSSYLKMTDNTLEAVMEIIILNIHASSPIATPLAPAMTPDADDLPSPGALLGQFFQTNMSSFLYTPPILLSDRSDLNGTWSNAGSALIPEDAYFNNETNAQGNEVSSDGWPSPSITEFTGDNHQRLLFGFGQIDPQMSGYNLSGEATTIFPPGYLENRTIVVQEPDGSIASGCIYNPNSTRLSSANSSWAVASVSFEALSNADYRISHFNGTLPSVGNMTSCGISPFLNHTLANTTADVDIVPYLHFAVSSIWAWEWEQPSVYVNGTNDACAVLVPTSPTSRWQTAECNGSHYAACRVDGLPHLWNISTSANNYTLVGDSCPPNSSFDVPRTALENRYLAEAYRASKVPNASEPLWVNLNSLDVQFCWVSGVNTTCPYDVPTNNRAQIYVPTVAGVIILVITALLIVVKCGANRAHSKRKRKGENGWDYEGVPS